MLRTLPAFVVLILPTGASAQPLPAKIDFNRDVRPILSNNCFHCHGPDEKERKADLRLDVRTAEAIGKPGDSPLLDRVTTTEKRDLMPPPKSGKTLTQREKDILKQWVQEGASYATHWAYVKPTRPPVPETRNTKHETRNTIDAFILDRLAREKLSPSPAADKLTLARRVALDLTGLPPTPEEVDAYLKDTSADAYEKLVDRLMAKPAFGEHWARMWLDLARYADSAGYADDPPRTIWKYRDWVIRAFNENQPFDRFTIEQLAGDMLPKPTDEQLTATAFHRNTLTNSEGGTNDEEFRNVAVVDRVNTTFTVWMGTSMACAQCHTHKYDPLTQKEFFASFAFFNNTADADRNDESPTLPFWTPETLEKKKTLEAAVAELEAKVKGKKADEMKKEFDQLAAKKKELAAVKPPTSVPVMKELDGKNRRVTKLQYRGNFMDLGDVVTEGTPAAFHGWTKDAPKTRLEFAKWLVSNDNPLTARVIANRFWEAVFGVGLVRTSEEFGTQGEPPSHPELLDWLACELAQGPGTSVPGRAPGPWNVKAFLKLLVTSAAYKQSSKVTPAAFERDPENRLLARGPRVRLTAEMVRDQALAASGLLSAKMYGPSVKPPQPNLGVSAAFGGAIDWQTSTGEDKFRRGLYVMWRRSNPYPSMSTFDAPNRDVCAVRRTRTNTPLQALVLMNDPVYIEAAQALAKRVTGTTIEDDVKQMFRHCLVRPPTAEEVKRLVALHADARERFEKDAAKSKALAATPAAAAKVVVASVLLNLDEMLMKP
jgi:hypothetical protein